MRKIWIDCDPGIDDAAAFIFAAAHKDKYEILGISTVNGNQTIDKVTANALDIVDLLKLDVDVVKGCDCPLSGSLVTGEKVHGETGLGTIVLPKSKKKPVTEPAADYIYKKIMSLPKCEKVTLIGMGPLTNFAVLFQNHPEIKERIEEIIFMGGAAWGGNVTASAEFNVYADPKAAKLVLESGVSTVMCGLDVTMKCGITKKQIAKLCQIGGPMSKLCGDLMGQFLSVPVYQTNPVMPVHDAVPFMYLIHPEIFGGEKLPVDVDCSFGIGRGQTICDRRYLQDEEDLHVKVLLKADSSAFQEYFIDSLFEMDENQ